MFILLVFLALAVGYFQSALEAQERQNQAFQSASQD